MQKIDVQTISDRIAVQAPYFAFGDLEVQNDNAVRGLFVSEQPLGYERGPVSTAEIGRHLAILGSCAAVVGQATERTYYLATKARYSMLESAPNRGPGRTFAGTAEVLKHDRRSLTAQAIVSDTKPFAHLHCEYQMLSEKTFTRLFNGYRVDASPIPEQSPYRERVPLEFDEPRGASLTAHSRPLAPVRCAGHFLHYPAWPVAIIADTICQVMTRLLHHVVGREVDYSIVRTDLCALKLVSALEPLSFEAECLSASPALSHYVFAAKALRGAEVVATVDTELRV